MRYSRHSFSRFIPMLLVIIITIVAIAAVLAIGQALLGGGTKKEPPTQADPGKEALLSSDLSRSVRVTVRGPIVADEKFRSYQITVAPNTRTMTTHEGYLEKQLEAKTFDNNTKAYEELVYALDKRKMMDGRPLPDDKNDLRGICATGKVYKFETLMNGEPVKTLWTSDCSGSKGSAAASVHEILDMFLKQIPEGKKMAASVGLNQQETPFRL
ncbi:MAG: hypothetical protein Q4B05_03450 [Candidatus Saccharibacteria bacterium]|nr:hypothetical protein [Candidatus Saccharibacteria bacterium]